MSRREFLEKYRQFIDDVVAMEQHRIGMKLLKLPANDKERWDWVENYEFLYLLAKSEGVEV